MSDHPLLREFPVHLGLGGVARPLPRFTGSGEWYGAYEAAHQSDGPDGRLVSWHEFTESWDSWEMHPGGEELVVCVSGRATFVQELDGEPHGVVLEAGQWMANPAGVWHTADVAAGESVACVFITSGLGTQGRSR